MQRFFSMLYAFVEHSLVRDIERGLHYLFLAFMFPVAFSFLLIQWLGIPVHDYFGVTWEGFVTFATLVVLVMIIPGLASVALRYVRHRFQRAKKIWGRGDMWQDVPMVLNTTLLISAIVFVTIPVMGYVWLSVIAALYVVAYACRSIYLAQSFMERLQERIKDRFPSRASRKDSEGKGLGARVEEYLKNA